MKQIQLLVTVQIPDTSPQYLEDNVAYYVSRALEDTLEPMELMYQDGDSEELFNVILESVELCPSNVSYEKYEKHEGWTEATEEMFVDEINKTDYSVLGVRKLIVLEEKWGK